MSGMRQAELLGPFRDKVLAHKFRPDEMRARRTPAMAWSNSMSPIRRGHGDGYHAGNDHTHQRSSHADVTTTDRNVTAACRPHELRLASRH